MSFVHIQGIGLLLMMAFSRLTRASYMGMYYPYNSSFSSLATLFWFIMIIFLIIALLVLSCLVNAVMQWCAIFTLRGQKADGVKIFTFFVKAEKNRVLKANILMTIYIFFWSLLLTIPGIVKSASYAMTNYLLEKDDSLTASEAINLSRQIMHGYKLELLILRYSFYFWSLVTSISLGLASFYVLPYQTVTEIQFLEMLYNEYMQENEA